VTKPQRVALALVPLISVGLLSWLPMLYMYLRDTAKRYRLLLAVGLLIATGVITAGLVTAERGTGLSLFYGLLWVWLVAISGTVAWMDSRPQVVAKDPYA